jgi:hypothetical protein
LGLALVLAAILGMGASAATLRYDATIQADGQTLGVASGTVDVSAGEGGKLSWKLSDGTFVAATLPHATVVFDASALSGSGSAEAGETVALKEINATVAQSTGVDVTYRFQVYVTLAGGAPRALSIRQMK